MNRQTVILAPGDYFIGDERYRVRTLLGSCVSITLWHPQRRIGAMSHYLLAQRPERPERSQGGALGLDARYGTEAMRLMIHGLMRRGLQPEDCEAKVFGGAHMFPAQEGRWPEHVGQRNGNTAVSLLREWGIALVASCLFGYGHRTVIFDIATGEVWARQSTPANKPIGRPRPGSQGDD